MSQKSISRLQSFGHAVRGLKVVFAEPNAQIHLMAAALAIGLGVHFQISVLEWVAVFFAIASVMGAEALMEPSTGRLCTRSRAYCTAFW